MEKLKLNVETGFSIHEDICVENSAKTLKAVQCLSRQLNAEHLYIITLQNVFDVEAAEQLSPDKLCEFLRMMKSLLSEIIKDTDHPVSDFTRPLH